MDPTLYLSQSLFSKTTFTQLQPAFPINLVSCQQRADEQFEIFPLGKGVLQQMGYFACVIFLSRSQLSLTGYPYLQ